MKSEKKQNISCFGPMTSQAMKRSVIYSLENMVYR